MEFPGIVMKSAKELFKTQETGGYMANLIIENKKPITQKKKISGRGRCTMCGSLSSDTICDHCKILVQAEALEKKRRAGKSTRV